ncbi:YbaB/EbfC family DNA-binding protein [Micromonospora sp. DR5-3]|uniref:YbaB/EbfC family DNA-binding protein n=1 Tax=unclassified Micromonospora TaxID=2617518 RepID=UPI0011D3DF3B|nr:MULTISPECIES: YbaB/EbfC family DNA-binding protein [unclassified Micromonospora]MCW3817450.1 YbaB/EbfC family DNA-binding protein [Micromonospora sp. DR5-3]TYC22876.1 YbaB/EbfC family DNA-binding protein [Micromonospora sp. MP36]
MTNDSFSAAASLDELLTRTQQALSAMRSRAAEHPDGDPGELLRAEGTAADGRVRARVVQGGRLESVTVDPALEGEGLAAVCGHVVVAVNAALAELDAQVSASAQADVDALAARLGGLEEQPVRQVELFSRAVDDVLGRLNRGGDARAGRPG